MSSFTEREKKDEPPTWKVVPEGIIISIKVIPKSSRSAIVGWENGELKIRVAAAPEKGNANGELIAFLSKELGVSKSRIRLISGETSRHKRVCLVGVDSHSLQF